MARTWNNNSYNESWEPVDGTGQKIGPKDEQAEAANRPAAAPWSPSASAMPATPSAMQTSVTNKLFSEMNLSPSVDTNDPAYRQQIDANRFTADRTADRARAAQAQRMAVNGTATGGGLETGIGRIISDQGAQEQGFEAQLMGKFRDQNLDRMSRALQLGAGLMTAEQERDLRAALTREGYGVQERIAGNDLGFRRDALGQQGALSQAQLDQNALLALLG